MNHNSIVTLTFNPALDVSTSVDALLPEKKLKCAEPFIEPGGGGINVARAVKKLGGEALAVYPAGGDTGRAITNLLKAADVPTSVVRMKGATRQNLIIADRSSGGQYLFDMPGTRLNTANYRTCLKIIRDLPEFAYLVVSGSLPQGYPADLFNDLADITQQKHAKLIVDTSGEPLREAIRAGAFLVKPNLKELGLLTGEGTLTKADAGAAAKRLLAQSPCEAIVVSMGSQGALLITRKQSLHLTPPPVNILSTVGAGDSLLGGVVLRLAQGSLLTDAVTYGVACGTAATLAAGTELCRKADADRLYQLMIGHL